MSRTSKQTIERRLFVSRSVVVLGGTIVDESLDMMASMSIPEEARPFVEAFAAANNFQLSPVSNLTFNDRHGESHEQTSTLTGEYALVNGDAEPVDDWIFGTVRFI